MRKAIKKFWKLRDNGSSENEAAAACWETYKNVHLVPYTVWKPTQGNATERRGPVPPHFKMTKKTGPSPKVDQKLTAKAKQFLLRDPELSNVAIAQKLETAKKYLFSFGAY